MAQPRKPSDLSRQRIWQKNMVAAGRCAQCGARRPTGLKVLCRRCQNKSNDAHLSAYYRRKKQG